MNRKIKILFTTTNFDTAGSGKVIYDLVKGLDRNRFYPEIACEHNGGSFFKTITSLGVPIHIISTKCDYRPYRSLLTRLKPITKFIRTREYDIVHSWQWSSDWTEALASKRAGAKWVYTKKAMGFQSKHWHFKSYLADFIITINKEMKEYFKYKRNQRLIPLGIDTDYYAPVNKKKDNVREFRIITVANLVPVKGIEVLLKAIQQLNDNSIVLTVLGDSNNEYGTKLKLLCNTLGISETVDFLGKKNDVRPYISDSHLYVIPTLNQGRKEGMPMALVEAMSIGIPVLGSNISGINFVLKDFKDLLFEAGNSADLCKKIKELKSFSPKERLSLGQSLRSYCEVNFSMQRFIQAHEELYSQIAG